MKIKTFLGLFAITFLACSEIGECDPDDEYDEDLTPRQIEVIKNYHAIAKLSYGDRCNSDLESKGDKIREDLKPYLRNVISSAFQQGLEGDDGEFQLTSSQEDARDLVVEEIEKFTNQVKKSKYGLNGICNDTKSLYCDQSVEECRCGKRQIVKGFLFVHVEGDCHFDFGSGCIQSEFAELTTLECRKGSSCVTRIEKLECTLENTILEAVRNPSRFGQIKNLFGCPCFCDRKDYMNSNTGYTYAPATNLRKPFSVFGSLSQHFEGSSRLIILTFVLPSLFLQ